MIVVSNTLKDPQGLFAVQTPHGTSCAWRLSLLWKLKEIAVLHSQFVFQHHLATHTKSSEQPSPRRMPYAAKAKKTCACARHGAAYCLCGESQKHCSIWRGAVPRLQRKKETLCNVAMAARAVAATLCKVAMHMVYSDATANVQNFTQQYLFAVPSCHCQERTTSARAFALSTVVNVTTA